MVEFPESKRGWKKINSGVVSPTSDTFDDRPNSLKTTNLSSGFKKDLLYYFWVRQEVIKKERKHLKRYLR